MSSTVTSRRALLAGAAAVPLAVAVQTPSAALAADDPAFAAIERHRAIAAAWAAAVHAEDEESAEVLAAAENSAVEALLRLKPATVAGICAVLRYLNTVCTKDESGPFADFLNGSAHEVGEAGAAFFAHIADTIEAMASGRAA